MWWGTGPACYWGCRRSHLSTHRCPTTHPCPPSTSATERTASASVAASQPSPGSTVRGAPLGLEEMGGGLTCRTRWSPRPPPVAMFVSLSASPSQGPRRVKCSEPGVRQSPPKPPPPGLSSLSRRVCTDAGRVTGRSHMKVPSRAGCPIQHHWPHVAILIDSNEIKLKRQLRSCSDRSASIHMLHGIEQFHHHRTVYRAAPLKSLAPWVCLHFSVLSTFLLFSLAGRCSECLCVPSRLQRVYRLGPPFPPLCSRH